MTKTEILSRALESLEFVIGDLEYLYYFTDNNEADNSLKIALILKHKIERIINDQR